MRDELGVENSSWGETARSLAAREMGERRKETALGQGRLWKPNVCTGVWDGNNAAELETE